MSGKASPDSLSRLPQGQARRRSRTWANWGAIVALSAIALTISLLTALGALDSIPADRGWLPAVIVGVAAVGLAVGVVRRDRRWWARRGVGMAIVTGAVTALAAWWVHVNGFTGHYPPSFNVWAWAAMWAAGVAVTGLWSGPAALRVARVLAAPLVLFGSFILIDSHYGYWPTVGDLLASSATGQVSGSVLASELAVDAPAASGVPTKDGQYGPISISGAAVGLDAATAHLWLPPDFFQVDHASLPVLLMMPGWPGDNQDWARAGQVLRIANRWAAAHNGAAPVMVFVDENGALSHDTECVNGPQGPAESYLASVVPHFLEANLGISPDPSRWAAIGFSEGGTCAVGLATEHPGVYGRFVDLAGDLAPNYGEGQSARDTLVHLFGGVAAAERAHEPLRLLEEHSYPGTIGWFGAGRADRSHLAIETRLFRAAQADGMVAHLVTLPGTHSWIVASAALGTVYPHLVASLQPGVTELGHKVQT